MYSSQDKVEIWDYLSEVILSRETGYKIERVGRTLNKTEEVIHEKEINRINTCISTCFSVYELCWSIKNGRSSGND